MSLRRSTYSFEMPETPAPFTLRSAAGLPAVYGPLNDAVLLIIDAQVEYSPSGALTLPDLDMAAGNIALLLERARETGAEIVHIGHEGSPGRAFDPAAGGRFIEQAEPLEGETVIGKALPNAYANTGLQNHLAGLGRPHLVLVGFMTHMCVSSTARAALDLGYETTVVADATATRALPSVDGSSVISAETLHETALAALADRFSAITSTTQVLAH